MLTSRLKRRLRFLALCTLVITLGDKSYAICDIASLEKAEHEFKLAQAQINHNQISTEKYKKLARNYIRRASNCYHDQVNKYQNAANLTSYNNIKMDDGGVWMPGFGGNTSTVMMSEEQLSPTSSNAPFVLDGRKWGAGVFPSPGGTVSYSFMGNGVSMANEIPPASPNVAISSLSNFKPCFLENIRLAFSAWAAISNIKFVEVADNNQPFDNVGAMGDIRIGAHQFDGMFGTIAHAFFPPPNGVTGAGDLHFDKDESWACTPESFTALDIGIVALHEIGHSIGLKHQSLPTLAVMNPVYDQTITGLRQDDINGARAIYGNQMVTQQVTVFTPMNPCRIVDTRFSSSVGMFSSGQTQSFSINGDTSSQGGTSQCNIPDGIAKPSAIVLNLTSTASTASGYLTVWPSTQGRPNASILNYTAGINTANSAVIPISKNANLEISVYADTPTHLVIDVMGYFRNADLP